VVPAGGALQPEFYPKVDDEADITLTYKSAVAILHGRFP
jgi:hypothetical protein